VNDLAQLLIAGIAIEGLFQILRMIWEPAVRSEWNFTRLVMLSVVLLMVLGFSDWNLVDGTGLDIGIPVVGQVLTALAVVRITHWVHEFYKRTSR
jgi:hypothetical protein